MDKLETAIDELHYAFATGDDRKRDHYIKNAIRFIEESREEKDAEIKRLKEGIEKVLKYMEEHSGTVEVPKRLTTDGLLNLYLMTKKLIR